MDGPRFTISLKRSMDHFAGLDVSVKETSVCIVDDAGRIVREMKVASEPDALLPVLTNPVYHLQRIGLEAGPLSQWLFSALAEWSAANDPGFRRDQPNRRDIPVRRRDDAGHALRSSASRAGAFGEMVLAQGLGDADRQARRDEKGHRRQVCARFVALCRAAGLFTQASVAIDGSKFKAVNNLTRVMNIMGVQPLIAAMRV